MSVFAHFPALRTRTAATLLLLLAALAGGLGLFDRIERGVLPVTLAGKAEQALETNLTRAAALFASARALNAVISVAQSAQVSAGVGVQGTLGPGQMLDPLNDLVERFSAVMLTATVALGGSVLLVQAGDLFGLGTLLPAGLVLVALALWLPGSVGGGARRAGLILLVAALVAKLGLPLTVLATESVAERLVEPQIAAAETRLQGLEVPAAPGLGPDAGWADRLKAAGDITAQIERLASAAGGLADTVIDLTVAYALKIVVLPLITLWLVARLAEVLIAGLVPRRE